MKTFLPRILVVIAVVLSVSAFSARAQTASTNRSSISGFVFDTDRRPIANQVVELMNEVNSIIGRVRTDSSGRYYFGALSSGRFVVRVLSMGTNLQEQSVDVEIAGVGRTGRPLADNIQQDIYMRPRKITGKPTINEVVFAQYIPQEARDAFKDGVDDLEGNRLDSGITKLQKAIDTFPAYFAALERLGMVRLSQQNFDEARKLFDRAVKVNDDSYNCWYGLAYSSLVMKDAETAATAAQKASVINRESVDCFLLLGVALRQIKKYNEAETALKQAAKLGKGKFPDVHWNLALLYAHNLNKFGEAADQLELFLKESPEATNKDLIKKLIKQFREKAAAPGTSYAPVMS